MELKPLTKKQAKVLEFIISTVEKGYGPPSIREIGNEFSMKSTGSVRDVFKALIRKGYIVKTEMISRGNRLNPEVFSVKVTGRNRIKVKSS